LSDLQKSDIVITGHFHGNGAPDIITREMLQSKDCKIKVVGISCDINGPVPALRSSTIAEPFGYLPSDDKEVDVFQAAIVVMAVDNLPCELKDASEGFGSMFMEYVIPF
jgi:alanine dehydrogenase